MIDEEVSFNFQSLTVSTTAVSPTATVGDLKAHRAVITVETDQIRFRYDGTAPTSSVGHIMNPGERLIMEGRSNISGLQFIRSSAATADAVLRITIETI